MSKQAFAGFTITELIITLGIVSTLLGIAYPIIAQKAKRVLPAVLLLFFLSAPAQECAAEDDLTPISLLKFTAGIASSFCIHEASHALVAAVTNTHLSWEIGNYNQPLAFTENAKSNAKGLALYSAGLISQAIGAEVILQADRIDKNDSFVRGMMFWDIINPISYSLDYWFIHRSNQKKGNWYQGDLQGIEHYSSTTSAGMFAITMSGIAAYQGYRFLKTQTWAPDWLKGEKHKVALVPVSGGGLIMTYHFEF
jgi:prepilin-type N-terminal cleavage/methylation domain-containing protein